MGKPPAPDVAEDSSADPPGPAVLVVDDDAWIRQALEALLVDEGFVVALASDGRQALVAMAGGAPGLVLLDMTLPLLDGFQVAARLRADHGDVPVIVMSADGHVAEKARRVGAVAYLRKPFLLDDLVALVRLHARPSP